MSRRPALICALACACATVIAPAAARAASSAGASYRVQESTLATAGGTSSSASYGLTESTGEAFIGSATTTTATASAGFTSQLDTSITLSLSTASIALSLVPDRSSQAGDETVTVRTDAPGYQLLASEDHDLRHTDLTTTVPAVTGTIAAPAAWTEGTTTGFGVSVVSGTGVDPKWGTSPNYNFAAVTTSAAAIHAKQGYQSTADATVIRLRAAVPPAQKPGSYSNTVTITATALV
jgi:hypothetical protein